MSERGSALFVLMVALFFAGAGFVAFIDRVEVPMAPLERLARERMVYVAEAALRVCEERGNLPVTFASLKSHTAGDQDAAWNLDPYDPSREIDYVVAGRPAVLTVRSVGPDRLLGTADDVTVTRAAEPVQRAFVRRRLRWLRTYFFCKWVYPKASEVSQELSEAEQRAYDRARQGAADAQTLADWAAARAVQAADRAAAAAQRAAEEGTKEAQRAARWAQHWSDWAARTASRLADRAQRLAARLSEWNSRLEGGAMTSGHRRQWLAAIREWSRAQSAMRYATQAELASLVGARDAAAQTIQRLWAHYQLPDLPSSTVGSGGLLDQVGLSDSFARDAFGATLVIEPNVGFKSVGADWTGGTNDDL